MHGLKECVTEAGRIDIMARDANGRTVVIELKAETAAPDASTQRLAYIATGDRGRRCARHPGSRKLSSATAVCG